MDLGLQDRVAVVAASSQDLGKAVAGDWRGKARLDICVANAGVSGLIKSLSNEYDPNGVLVNSVCPGFIATARPVEFTAKLAAKEGVAKEDIEQRWARQTALGRLGQPEELADFVVSEATKQTEHAPALGLPAQVCP